MAFLTRTITFCVLLLSLLSCSEIFEKTPIHVEIGGTLQSYFIDKMMKKHKLEVYCTGGGMMRDIKNIQVSFSSYKPHNLEEARALYIDVLDELLDIVNSSEIARPYLHNYPFDITNTSICFSFYKKGKIPTPGVNHIIHPMESQRILYYRRDKDTNEWILLHEETYDEAKAILTQPSQEKKGDS